MARKQYIPQPPVFDYPSLFKIFIGTVTLVVCSLSIVAIIFSPKELEVSLPTYPLESVGYRHGKTFFSSVMITILDE